MEYQKNTFQIDIKVNFSGKRAGARLGPDLDLDGELLNKDLPNVITKRIIWRVTQGQYDPLGLLAPFQLHLKMVMHELCNE